MMGGVDTVMPDKIVKRVINGILEEAGFEPVNNDVEFVRRAVEVASACGYRPVELCWMTWMIQPVALAVSYSQPTTTSQIQTIIS